MKIIEIEDIVIVLLFDIYKDLVFIVNVLVDIKVFKFESNKVVILLNLINWCVLGFCYIMNGNFLLSMCLKDKK